MGSRSSTANRREQEEHTVGLQIGGNEHLPVLLRVEVVTVHVFGCSIVVIIHHLREVVGDILRSRGGGRVLEVDEHDVLLVVLQDVTMLKIEVGKDNGELVLDEHGVETLQLLLDVLDVQALVLLSGA